MAVIEVDIIHILWDLLSLNASAVELEDPVLSNQCLLVLTKERFRDLTSS